MPTFSTTPTYFARQGMLGVNGTYRLAPAAQWPAAAQDVGLLVKWLKRMPVPTEAIRSASI